MNYNLNIVLEILITISIFFYLINLFILKKINNYLINYLKNDNKYICLIKSIIFLLNKINFICDLFSVLFLSFIFRSFFYESFYIPSSSMFPNLISGDLILINKNNNKFLNYIINTIFLYKIEIKRGDIIVFKFPLNKRINYVKRVIGVPGDTIKYNFLKKSISIIPKNCNKSILKYKNLKNNKYNKNYFFFKRIETINNISYEVILYNLKLNNKKLFFIQKNYSIGKWIVPDNSYFVMGDNRDNSFDSRYWGFVEKKYITGKVIFIWMHIKKKYLGIPIKFNFNRIRKIS